MLHFFFTVNIDQSLAATAIKNLKNNKILGYEIIRMLGFALGNLEQKKIDVIIEMLILKESQLKDWFISKIIWNNNIEILKYLN